MSWQHYLYSKLGKSERSMEEVSEKSTSDKKTEDKKIEDTVERIVAMAKVLYGLHMVSKNIFQLFIFFITFQYFFIQEFYFIFLIQRIEIYQKF